MKLLLKLRTKYGLLLTKENFGGAMMIIGEMRSKDYYLGIHPKMKQAFDFLEACFTHDLEPGHHEIDGEDLYALVFHYDPQEKENPRYETHDRYIDIQCMVTGSEYHWYLPRCDLQEGTAYQADKDITFYPFAGEGSRLAVKPGDFTIFFPQDGHLAGMTDGSENACTRVVVKIKC